MPEDVESLGNESTDQTMKAFATVKARFKTDIESLTGLSREFGTLKDSLRSINDELTKMIALGAQTTTTLQGVAQAGGGVSGGAIPGPATGTGGRSKAGGTGGIAVASSSGMWQKFAGNLRTAQTNLNKPVTTGGFALNQAVQAVTQGMQWTQARVKGAAPYMLSSDRMGNLVRQMYGGTQLQYQANFREPLTDYLIGSEGITPLLGLQVSTGLNATQMAKGVEGIRVASGFGYSTQDATSMIRAMAQPGSSNLMTMMLGMGLYGPGGTARDPMDVVRNTVQRLGLTNSAMVEGALQPGSMTRANLARTGLPMDMQDLVIQYAQENVQFRNKGGEGMYDPSNPEHRSRMGVQEGYATEFERTRQSEMDRQENFYRRQIDNYEQLEENTQRLIEVFGKLEDTLSTIIGGQINMTNKWWRGALPLAGALAGGALGLFGGPATAFMGATAGYTMGKGAAGALGDPEPVATTDFSTYGLHSSLVGSGGSTGIQALANKAALPISEGGIATQLTLTSGVRSMQEQWNLFADTASGGGPDGRHTAVPVGQEQPGDRLYDGRYYRMNANGRRRGYAAPPGASKHQTGKAADLGPDEAHPFIAQNASRFGLKTAPGEDWHVTLTADARNTAVDTVLGQGRGGNPLATSAVQRQAQAAVGALSLTKLQRNHEKYTPVEYASVTQPVSMPSLAPVGDPHYASSASISQWGPGPWNSTLGGGSGQVITISPTLNLTGSGNDAVDAQRLADQVIKLIETSRVVQSLRRS